MSFLSDDVGDQLCERVLSVLLEIWLLACVKCYPTPPLWKTLREMAINWRHRTALIEQWNRINLTLTSKILEIMYGLNFSQLKIGNRMKYLGKFRETFHQRNRMFQGAMKIFKLPLIICPKKP